MLVHSSVKSFCEAKKQKKTYKNIKQGKYIDGIRDFTCDDSWSILKDEVNEGRRKMRQIISSIQPEVQLNPKTSAKTTTNATLQ